MQKVISEAWREGIGCWRSENRGRVTFEGLEEGEVIFGSVEKR